MRAISFSEFFDLMLKN